VGRGPGSGFVRKPPSAEQSGERLSPFRAFAPSEPDLAGVRTVAGDFHEGELADRCDTTKLVGDVVAEWLKRGEDRPTLSYAVNRAQGRRASSAMARTEIST
jgi:DNA repair protein RadD